MVRNYFPVTLSEALKIKRDDPETVPVAGGTDVMVSKKDAGSYLYLSGLKELKQTCVSGDDLVIGAGEAYRELLEEPLIPELLKAAMREVASPAIRNSGTLAGNICNASPAGDTLPPLYCMDAEVELSSMTGDGQVTARKLAISEFITGVRKLNKRPGELVTAVVIPGFKKTNGMKMYYEKVGARRSEAISKLSFAGLCLRDNESNIISDIRFAFGSVGITTVRRRDEELKFLSAKDGRYSDMAEEITDDFDKLLKPIDDQRSTAAYRKRVSLNILKDFLQKCSEGSL